MAKFDINLPTSTIRSPNCASRNIHPSTVSLQSLLPAERFEVIKRSHPQDCSTNLFTPVSTLFIPVQYISAILFLSLPIFWSWTRIHAQACSNMVTENIGVKRAYEADDCRRVAASQKRSHACFPSKLRPLLQILPAEELQIRHRFQGRKVTSKTVLTWAQETVKRLQEEWKKLETKCIQ